MMSSGERASNPTLVLRDLTNRQEKRSFLSILSDSKTKLAVKDEPAKKLCLGLHKNDGLNKLRPCKINQELLLLRDDDKICNSESEKMVDDEDLHSSGDLCLGLDHGVKDKKTSKIVEDPIEKGLHLLKEKRSCDSSPVSCVLDSSQMSNLSINLHVSDEPKRNTLLGHDTNYSKNGIAGQSVEEVCDASRDAYGSLYSKPLDLFPCGGGEERVSLNTGGENRDLCRVGRGSQETGEFIQLFEARETGSLELDRCTTSSTAMANDGHPLKACSCAFCLKAAFIWSDLQYQDVNGRMAAVRKSKKEARSLVEKYTRGKMADPCCPENCSKAKKLEHELMNLWRSLFQRMDTIFGHEINELQSSHDALRELREKCKKDLEIAKGSPPDNH